MTRSRLLSRLRRPGGPARAWLGLVLALAVALKLLVPQGWMPDARGGLMLCPGQMPVATMHHGDRHPTPAGPMQDHPCAFAALGLAATPAPDTFALPPSAQPDVVPVALRGTVVVGRGLAAPPPPATGPPTFA